MTCWQKVWKVSAVPEEPLELELLEELELELPVVPVPEVLEELEDELEALLAAALELELEDDAELEDELELVAPVVPVVLLLEDAEEVEVVLDELAEELPVEVLLEVELAVEVEPEALETCPPEVPDEELVPGLPVVELELEWGPASGVGGLLEKKQPELARINASPARSRAWRMMEGLRPSPAPAARGVPIVACGWNNCNPLRQLVTPGIFTPRSRATVRASS